MKLSIIVIMHNMRREAARTLHSLSRAYQHRIPDEDYEIIAIDNGSLHSIDLETLSDLEPRVRYHFHETASVSPVEAVNLGADMAVGDFIAVIVDGARMASPGLIRHSLAALRLNPSAFVCALSWHLGPDVQPVTIQQGYDQVREDALLAEINWQANGYKLFDISTIAPSSSVGFLGGFPPECSWFCMSRLVFQDLGGFNPAFQTPGGGLCNHEFRNRALRRPDLVPTVLLGEGVFHQVHGGVTTSVPPDRHPMKAYKEEYQSVFGTKVPGFQPAETVYFGTMHPSAERFVLPRRI